MDSPGSKISQSTVGSIVNLDPQTSLADSYVLLKTSDGKREIVQLEAIHSIQVLSDPPTDSKTSTAQGGPREISLGNEAEWSRSYGSILRSMTDSNA